MVVAPETPTVPLRMLLVQPFGRFLLVVVSLGLLGYATWRLIMAVRHPERTWAEAQVQRWPRRAGYLASVIATVGLAAAVGVSPYLP